MFAGKQPNPYDEVVAKTTDENLTSENWELILNLCDKVNDEGEAGARNVIGALLKRLAHRNPNVQLYSLALGEALSKNCGVELHREMASRSFTGGLEKLVTDRTTHEKVKRRALYLISLWAGEFESNPELGMMDELYNTLKGKNFKFEEIVEAAPPDVDDEVRRREEEELQRVIEMSLHDKGGRNASAWGASSSAAGSSAAPASSSAKVSAPPVQTSYKPVESPKSPHSAYAPPAAAQRQASPPISHAAARSSSSLPEQVSPSRKTTASASGPVTRVRALHDFEPTVAGELAFQKGEIIKVTDRAYDNWWRGQLRGRTGIFPVNYVEPLPDLTAEDIAREAEQEASVFAQAANIDKLITMLRGLDPSKDNLADNEEIQELYRSSMALRPKIVKLIDKYSQKRAELVAMNENFVKARGAFEQMMEESLARHTGVYDNAQPTFRKNRSDSRVGGAEYHASTYGWNPQAYEQPGYNGYPAAPTAYQGPPYAEPTVYSGQHQPPPTFPTQMPQGPQPYPPVDHNAYASPPPQSATPGHPVAQQPQHPYGHHGPAPTDPQAYAQQNPQAQVAQVQQEAQPQVQPQNQPQPQSQPQPQTQSQQQQPQAQAQPTQSQSPAQLPQGPPYVFDPKAQYADPNVQAWAQYYAQGGTDPAGAVYFISIPGVSEPVKTPEGAQPTQGAAAQPTSPTGSTHAQSYGAQDASQQGYPFQQPQGQQPYQPSTYSSGEAQGQQGNQPQAHLQPGYQPPEGQAPTTAAPYSATPHGYAPSGFGPSSPVHAGAPYQPTATGV